MKSQFRTVLTDLNKRKQHEKTQSTVESWIANSSILKSSPVVSCSPITSTVVSVVISGEERKKVLGMLLNITKKHQLRYYVMPHVTSILHIPHV